MSTSIATGSRATATCTHTAKRARTSTPTSRNGAWGARSRQAYGIGLVHGIGGSAGIGVLLLAAIPDHAAAALALLVFAAAAAASMATLSSLFGYVLTRGPVVRRVLAVMPVMGMASLLFGTWYALGAIGVVTYGL